MNRKRPTSNRTRWILSLAALLLLAAVGVALFPDIMAQWEIQRESTKWKQRVSAKLSDLSPSYAPSLMEMALLDKTTALSRNIDKDTTLALENSPYLVSDQATVQSGVTLTVPAGVEILFGPQAYLVSLGSLQMHGTAGQPISLKPAMTNMPWGGIFIGDGLHSSWPASRRHRRHWTSDLVHVHFDTSLYGVKAAHASVRMEHVLTRNVRELYSGLNSDSILRRARFTYDQYETKGNVNLFKFYKGSMLVEGCEIQCPQTDKKLDAMDIDSVASGMFLGNSMVGSMLEGTDGIDIGVNSKNILVANNLILYFNDKGVSVGEGAESIVITNNVMAYCGMGVGIKDSARAQLRHNTFYQNHTGVACYEKTPGLGGGHAVITACLFLGNISRAVARDSLSTITVAQSVCDRELLPGPGNQQRVLQLQDPARLNFRLLPSSQTIDLPGVGASF